MSFAFVFLVAEAALRAALGAAVVWCGMRILRIRNVPVQKAAWGMVLAAALAMPLLLHWHLRPVTVSISLPQMPPQPLAAIAPDSQQAPATTRAVDQPAQPDVLPRVVHSAPLQIESGAPTPAPQPKPAAAVSPRAIFRPSLFTPHRLVIAGEGLYLGVCSFLLFRLVWGLCAAVKLWLEAEPLRAMDGLGAFSNKGVRSTRRVAAPINIGSGVLLPSDYAEWDAEKLRIVMAHERAHIRQGDFYLQTAAGLYAAVFWFSPLGWWLKRKLSELGEAISDRAGLDEAASRSSYAQILLEFAARPHPTLIGVAMARRSNLSHRIEQLLNETKFRQAFAPNRRTFVTALLVPVVLFAATTLVRVEATAQAPQQAAPASPQAPSSSPAAQPAAPDAAQAPSQPAPATAPSAAPAASAAPGQVEVPPIHVDVPAVHVHVPAVHVDVPAKHIDIPAKHIDIPAKHIDVPAKHIDIPAKHIDIQAQHIEIPAQHIDIPAQHIDQPAQHIDVPAQHIDVPEIHIDVQPSGDHNSSEIDAPKGPAPELYAMLTGFGHALFLNASPMPPSPPVLARVAGMRGRTMMVQEAPSQDHTFDRTLTVSGKAELSVATGAGNIHLTKGAAGQIKIHGIVHAGNGANPDDVKQILANPPIEQDGNMIRVGSHKNMQDREIDDHLHNISISYEIEAPADTALNAATGSGNITDEGVGADAKLTTGSGNINATGLSGSYKITTGSGNINLEQSGSGDGKAQTGSGNLEIKDVQGGLNAMTGSGEIKASGTPSAPWKLMTGSGSIELWAGNAPMTLTASVGSGSIHTDHEMVMEGTVNPHHIVGKINGGGTEVRAEAGSGNITIH
jgi:hypothetical protein